MRVMRESLSGSLITSALLAAAVLASSVCAQTPPVSPQQNDGPREIFYAPFDGSVDAVIARGQAKPYQAALSAKTNYINGVVGHQTYKNNGFLSYTVWKLGATYDFGGGFNAGAYYKGTDAEELAYTVKGKDWGKDRLVAFVSYSF